MTAEPSGEPTPKTCPKDAALEYRFGVPTPEQLVLCTWWLTVDELAIKFKNADQRPVVWRQAGDYEWQFTDCPQPLKPHGMTLRELDALVGSPIAKVQP